MQRFTAVLFASLLAGGTLAAQPSVQAEKMLESARHKEVMEGDLKAAIEQYRKVAAQFAKQPDIAARALYQLGQCQEKLGQAEARKSYERIVKEYGSARQVAASARARLAALGGASTGVQPGVRLIWDAVPRSFNGDGGITSDGRWTAGTRNGEIVLRDLTTGEERQVTKGKSDWEKALGWVESPVVSPDGSHVAFRWAQMGKAGQQGHPEKYWTWYSLRVVRADGSGERILLEAGPGEYDEGPNWKWYGVHAWSSDGKSVAVQEGSGGNTVRLLVAPVDGSTPKTVLDLKRPAVFQHARFSPDGRWLAYDFRVNTDPETSPAAYAVPVSAAAPPREIARNAHVAGWSPDSGNLVFFRGRDNKFDLLTQAVSNGQPVGEPRKLPAGNDLDGYVMGITSAGSVILFKANRNSESIVAGIDPASGRLGKTLFSKPGPGLQPDPATLLTDSLGPRFSPDGARVLLVLREMRILIRSLRDNSEYTLLPQMKGIH